MKVFISWSGTRSRLVAELLKDWIACVIQVVEPWISSEDIERGSLWFSEITNQLKDTTVGIVCLTQENKEKPWIMFESGALAKGLSSNRVCPLLIDLETQDVKAPLAQFNLTLTDKSGVRQLVRTINSSLQETAMPIATLEKVFETFWPQFEENFRHIIDNTSKPDEQVDPRKPEDILSEVLDGIRSLDRRMRNVEYPHSSASSDIRQNPLVRPVTYYGGGEAAKGYMLAPDPNKKAHLQIDELLDQLSVWLTGTTEVVDVEKDFYKIWIRDSTLSVYGVKIMNDVRNNGWLITGIGHV